MTETTDHNQCPLILVVDDDMPARFIVREALEQAGFAVEEADDGAPALSLFETLRPDMVLLDIMMPKMDGFATCSALRALPGGAYTPILMMTGLDDVESINRAYEVGATDFVTKPINYLILTYRVRYMLRAKRTADELRASETLLSHAQRIAKLGHWEWNAEKNIAHCSDGVCHIFGLPSQESSMPYEDFLALIHPDDEKEVKKTIHNALHEGKNYSLEHRIVRRDGTERIVHQEGEVCIEEPENTIRVLGTIQDITERKRAEEKIRYLAYYDDATGLPNRTFLREHLGHALTNAKRYERLVAIMFIDLDHFKRINDTLGHSAGDQLLREVATRLQKFVRGSDFFGRYQCDFSAITLPHTNGNTVARIGGDEFVVLLTEIGRVEDAAIVVRRLVAALSPPVTVEGNETVVTASIGISAYPVDGDDIDTLLKNAEAAMYHAKERGRNSYQFYTESINARAVKRFSIETDLRKALERNELVLYYQPKVDVQKDRVVGMEALVRWQHPTAGMISPAEFIPIAEESGLIVPLGEWVLRTACAQTKAWLAAGLPPLKVSVNLSAVQFKQKRLGERIARFLQDTGLDPRLLELELTESLLMENTEASIATMNELKAIGLDISIDDFGTGYSSLGYLKRFPLSTLKIDRSFVRDIVTDHDNAAIVTATIALAHSLRLRVVAEGVEDQEQLDFLHRHGCDEIQGFLFSRPLPYEKIAEWVQAREHIGVLEAMD